MVNPFRLFIAPSTESSGRFFRHLHTFSFAILSKYAIRRLV